MSKNGFRRKRTAKRVEAAKLLVEPEPRTAGLERTLRRRRAPDTRPHWSDPNLPCIRDYKMANGAKLTEVSPDYERRYREHLMEVSENPGWKRDPTYNLRKPK